MFVLHCESLLHTLRHLFRKSTKTLNLLIKIAFHAILTYSITAYKLLPFYLPKFVTKCIWVIYMKLYETVKHLHTGNLHTPCLFNGIIVRTIFMKSCAVLTHLSSGLTWLMEQNELV